MAPGLWQTGVQNQHPNNATELLTHQGMAHFQCRAQSALRSPKVTLDNTCGNVQDQHFFPMMEKRRWNLTLWSLPKTHSLSSFLFSLTLLNYKYCPVGSTSYWRTCRLSWMARRALAGCWASPPSPWQGGCQCSPPAPGCGCPSSEEVLCASPAPAAPLHRSDSGTQLWHRKDCCPGMKCRLPLAGRTQWPTLRVGHNFISGFAEADKVPLQP